MQGTVSFGDFLWAALDEVYEKFLRLGHLVDERENELPFHRAVPIVDSFRTEINGKVREIEARAARLSKLPFIDGNTALTYWLSISELASDFLKLHGSFRWFSNPWVSETTYRFLEGCFESAMGSGNYLAELKGSLAYTPIYNFGFAAVDEYFSTNGAVHNVAWVLPYAEQDNPLMWPLILHEVGHEIVNKSGLVSQLARATKDGSDEGRNWFEELGADYIATRILGPGYFFALGWFAVLVDKANLRAPRQNHPSSAIRLEAIEATLQKFGIDPDGATFAEVGRLRDLINQRKEIDRLSHGQPDYVIETAEVEQSRWRSIIDVLDAKCTELRIDAYRANAYQLAKSLSVKMFRGETMASYPNERAESVVRTALKDYRDGMIEAPALFGRLAIMNELPAKAGDIVVAGWISRLTRKPRIQTAFETAKEGNLTGLDRSHARESIREADKLLQKSLEVSVVHRGIAQSSISL